MIANGRASPALPPSRVPARRQVSRTGAHIPPTARSDARAIIGASVATRSCRPRCCTLSTSISGCVRAISPAILIRSSVLVSGRSASSVGRGGTR